MQRRPALIERAQYEMQDLGKGGLTITYKQHAPAFREALGGANVAHHGGLIGADPLPPRRQGADFRRTVPVRSRDCPDCQLRGRPHRPGRGPGADTLPGIARQWRRCQFNRMAYRDPAAQAVLQRVYDSAAIQAIGRARPLLRTAADPVEIIYCGNIPLPFPVASIGRLHPVTKLEKVIASRVVPLSGADLARFHPDLFPSAEAGRGAIWRAGGRAEVWAATRQAAGRWPVPSVRVIYQPAGQGYGPRDLVVRRDQLAEIEAAARREFPAGLARWEVRRFSDGRSPIEAGGEDRFARVFKTKRGHRNALLHPPRRRRSVPRPPPAPLPTEFRAISQPVSARTIVE